MKLAMLRGFQNRNNVTVSCLPYVIGRCRSADFIIAHVNVSRNHCEIIQENGSWKIKDHSSSGTYVNGSLVGKGKCGILNDGDSIRFGPVESNLSWIFYTGDSNDLNAKRNLLKTVSDFQNEECSFSDNCFGRKNNESNEDNFVPKFSRDKIEFKKEVSFNKKYRCTTTKEGQNISTKYSNSSEKEYYNDKNKAEKIQESMKELKQIKHVLIDLEEKNSAPKEELVAKEMCKTEPTNVSNLLENLTDLMEAEFQCTICSELFVIAVTLSCTHTFCKYCINQWKKKQKTCPICRKKITNETRSLVVDNYIDKMVGNFSVELTKRREDIIEERKKFEQCKKKAKLKSKNL